MEKEKIENAYEFQLFDKNTSYIYSVKKDNPKKPYTYYIITQDEQNNLIKYEIPNPLDVLQKYDIKWISIKNDPSRFEEFLKKINEIQKDNLENSQKTRV